jgi:hypothetical protein
MYPIVLGYWMESHLRGFNLLIKIAHLRTYFIVRGVVSHILTMARSRDGMNLKPASNKFRKPFVVVSLFK